MSVSTSNQIKNHPPSTHINLFRWLTLIALFSLILAPTLNGQEVAAQRTLDREEQANVNVFKQSSPSVVNISTRKAVAARDGSLE